MAFFAASLFWPVQAISQTYFGNTRAEGSGIYGNQPSYNKCYVNQNAQTRFYPDFYNNSIAPFATDEGAVRIKYEILNNSTNQVVWSHEYRPWEDYTPRILYWTLTQSDIENTFTSNFGFFNPAFGQYYRFRITIHQGKRVGFWGTFGINNWSFVASYETTPTRIILKDANPEFTLTSQIGTDASGRPISCATDVRINGSASTCETVYYLEVTETDQWWNHAYPQAQFAGLWFTGEVKDVNLQWFCANYGNPLPTTVSPVSGQIPSSYGGFQMQERPYPGNLTPNFYRIKLVTFQNAWKEKNMLIDVDGSCKTDGQKTAFDPTSMVPMTQAELDALFQRHGNPLVDEALLAENSLERSVNLYPNPALEYTILQGDLVLQQEDITITDLYGNIVPCPINALEDGKLEINTNKLTTGLYIITIQSQEYNIRKKLWID